MYRGLYILLLLVSPWTQAGEVYRWTDSQGSVHYSDQPPPANAKQRIVIKGKGNVIDVDKESYTTRLARDTNPVVLYANNCGPICDDAREHLQRRGISFTAKDPSKDPEIAVELKKLVGVLEVPVIVVGKSHQKGFDPGSWDSLLDSAGYPRTPLIPPGDLPPRQP